MSNILIGLLLAGLCGMLGQGIRVLAGLKKMNDEAQKRAADSSDLFNAARLVISLMVGFLAGIAAALAVGLDKFLGVTSANPDLLFGVAAAGYAGTDFLESFAPTIVGKKPPVLGPTPTNTGDSIGSRTAPTRFLIPSGRTVANQGVNQQFNVTFGALVPGGFFSADPVNLNVRRSIRTNNPGALNFSTWQEKRLGYVGVTQPDNSPNRNVTTIYRTPEHGVAAWYYLISHLYNFSGGSFSLDDLARRYAGGNDPAAIRDYIVGWTRWLDPSFPVSGRISVGDTTTMATLGKAMFSHEAAKATPVHDDQILFGIENEKAGTLPE
jgi:hypothetical protein